MQKIRIAIHQGKVLVSLRRDIHEVDVIAFDDQLWMVPEWTSSSEHPEWSRPARMIRIDTLPISRIGELLVISGRVPSRVFSGKGPFNALFDVRLHPDIRVERHAP